MLRESIPSSRFAGRVPARSPLLLRKCACGNHTPGGGKCAACESRQPSRGIPVFARVKETGTGDLDRELGSGFGQIAGRPDRPAKASGALPEDREKAKPSPTQGSATIQCNGSGDYEIVYGSWAGATCGTKNCVTTHEGSHMADWKAKWPTGCQGQPKGYLPKGDPPDNPLMSVSEYDAFLKDSECRAHTADLACAEALPKQPGCDKTIEDYVKLTKEQKANWCPGLSAGAIAGIALGALAGAAAIGVGIAALAGAF